MLIIIFIVICPLGTWYFLPFLEALFLTTVVGSGFGLGVGVRVQAGGGMGLVGSTLVKGLTPVAKAVVSRVGGGGRGLGGVGVRGVWDFGLLFVIFVSNSLTFLV